MVGAFTSLFGSSGPKSAFNGRLYCRITSVLLWQTRLHSQPGQGWGDTASPKDTTERRLRRAALRSSGLMDAGPWRTAGNTFTGRGSGSPILAALISKRNDPIPVRPIISFRVIRGSSHRSRKADSVSGESAALVVTVRLVGRPRTPAEMPMAFLPSPVRRLRSSPIPIRRPITS